MQIYIGMPHLRYRVIMLIKTPQPKQVCSPSVIHQHIENGIQAASQAGSTLVVVPDLVLRIAPFALHSWAPSAVQFAPASSAFELRMDAIKVPQTSTSTGLIQKNVLSSAGLGQAMAAPAAPAASV
jgi:hypothetical protein